MSFTTLEFFPAKSTYLDDYKPWRLREQPIKYDQPHSFTCGYKSADRIKPKATDPNKLPYLLKNQNIEVKDLNSRESKLLDINRARPNCMGSNKGSRNPFCLKTFSKLQNETEEHIEDLVKRYRWTSTTLRATEEGKLNSTKPPKVAMEFEKNADMVQYRPQKYDAKAAEWQKVAGLWERIQTRAGIDSPLSEEPTPLKPSSLLWKRKKQDLRERNAELLRLSKENRIPSSYERQRPCYAGFVPRLPIKAPTEKTPDKKEPLSVMKLSYRKLPSNEYGIQQYHHEGPLSKTVTLTYPYNPFNKVEKRSMKIDIDMEDNYGDFD